jgi:SulP family sulfate permease
MTADRRPRTAGRRAVGDLIGGFVAGLYSAPEGIGYASLAGISPMQGIYACMVPVAVAAATTGSVLMMSTLTSAIALTIAGVVDQGGYPADQVSQASSRCPWWQERSWSCSACKVWATSPAHLSSPRRPADPCRAPQ